MDKGSDFYNRSSKSWLQDNDIEIYLTHNEGKPAVAERFIRTLKNKIYKYMPLMSKNMCMDKITDTVNEYNNTFHRTINLKLLDVKQIYRIYGVEYND